MSDIFLSYAREDAARVEPLARALEMHGWSVFWDRVIPAGRTWRDVIGSELEEARVIVVVWSKASVKSHWVLEEAEIGRERDVLLPVLIDEVAPPLGFRAFQAADLIGWKGDGSAPSFTTFVAEVARNIPGRPPQQKIKTGDVSAPFSKTKIYQQPLFSLWVSAAIYSIFTLGLFLSEKKGEDQAFPMFCFNAGFLLLGAIASARRSVLISWIFGLSAGAQVTIAVTMWINRLGEVVPFLVLNSVIIGVFVWLSERSKGIER